VVQDDTEQNDVLLTDLDHRIGETHVLFLQYENEEQQLQVLMIVSNAFIVRSD